MGFLAPIIPHIPQIAGAIGGIFGAKKAQKSAMQRSPEEQAALSGATNAAGGMTQLGQNLTGVGLPYVQNAGNYFNTLLGGNRAAMSLATAGPRASITEQGRGVEKSLERSGVRGGIKDLALAENARDTAAKTMGLTTGVQPGAADALSRIGAGLTGQGVTALSSGGSLYGNLLGQGFQNRQYGRQEGEKAGGAFGSLIADLLKGFPIFKGGGSKISDFGPFAGGYKFPTGMGSAPWGISDE